jgi:hypothetical protein
LAGVFSQGTPVSRLEFGTRNAKFEVPTFMDSCEARRLACAKSSIVKGRRVPACHFDAGISHFLDPFAIRALRTQQIIAAWPLVCSGRSSFPLACSLLNQTA